MSNLESKRKIISEKVSYEEADNFIFNLSLLECIDNREKFLLEKYNKKIHGILDETPHFPMIVKQKNSYKYNGKIKERYLYLFVTEQLSENEYRYYIIKANGRLHGRHYLRTGYIENLEECNSVPDSVKQTVEKLSKLI